MNTVWDALDLKDRAERDLTLAIGAWLLASPYNVAGDVTCAIELIALEAFEPWARLRS